MLDCSRNCNLASHSQHPPPPPRMGPRRREIFRSSTVIVLGKPTLSRRTANKNQKQRSEGNTYLLALRVIGELKSNQDNANRDSSTLKLANYARKIFGNQPNRRWAHGFILTRCLLRVWRFDRAGACGSTLIGIHTEPTLFLRAMKSHLTMDATQIGFGPSIRWSSQSAEGVFDPTAYCVADNPPCPFIYVPAPLEDTTANPLKAHQFDHP